MASTRSDKWFDVTYVLKKFSANEDLTFEDIAKEFGMSEEEMEERLTTMAGDDERDRVKRAKKVNKKRIRRKSKTATAKEIEEISMDENTTNQLEVKRNELQHEIDRTEQKLSASKDGLAEMKSKAEATQSTLAGLQNEVNNRIETIKNLQEKLNQAKIKLAKIQAKLSAETQKANAESESLQHAMEKMNEDQEYLEALYEELESLDDFVVNLIDPNYNLSNGLPEIGRLISTVELDGVDAEAPVSDIDELEFSKMLTISRKTGFDNILELGVAYQFAWLVIKYKTDSNYETNVITDDERIIKLIDLLME
jgi:chromosome segregation ATPase